MQAKQQIIDKLTQFLKEREEILFAYIFGSFVSKENYHDIDIAVFLRSDFDKNNYTEFPYGYESKLLSELNILLKYKIDLLVINNANITIVKKIINNGILLFSKADKKRISFENHIRKLYIDAENLRKIKKRYLQRKINNA